MPLAIACSNEEQVLVVASPVTGATPPRPAQIQGALRVTVQSGTGTFTQDPARPLEFQAVSGDDPGETVYLVEGDADLGEGEVLIQDTVTLTVNGANAQAFGLSSGPVTRKPGV